MKGGVRCHNQKLLKKVSSPKISKSTNKIMIKSSIGYILAASSFLKGDNHDYRYQNDKNIKQQI
jgi:hypothetical protein